MESKQTTTIFEVLSPDVHLALFRLLVKYALEGLVVGKIARYLHVTNTKLSFHLKALLAELVTMGKEGRFLRYKANISAMLDTIAYLTAEYCFRHPER